MPALRADERVVREERLHPIVFVGAFTMAAFVALATTFIVRNNDLAPETQRLVVAGGLVLAVLSVLPTAGRWWRSGFAVTDHRFLARIGWVRPRLLALAWTEVDAVDVAQSALGRVLGYGTLRLAAGDGAIGFPHVAGVAELERAAREYLGNRARPRGGRPARGID